MGATVFELALLLSLKDAWSGGLDKVEAKLRKGGKAAKGMLEDFQSLRKGLQQDLAIGGTGVALLTMLGKGVGVAGNFESAITDLRLSIEETGKDGQVNMSLLNDQMARFQHLGMGLGNKLPGTTEDFVQMFAVMKQGGIDTETVLNGAGQAAAYLAVVMKDVPKDLAEPLAQYGKQFDLKAEEYSQTADLFARVYRASGLKAQELIEGSKFFQLRAGAPLGLKGLEGAEVGARLMAALRSRGLEGGIAGREAAIFFSHIATHRKELAGIKKEFGIDMQIFDKKGNFLGFDNVFKQMEKLRGLSSQVQMEIFKKLGGDEGAGIGNIFMQMGESGWKQQYDRLKAIPPLQNQINEVTETFNSKLEAVKGTLTNLVATSFTPMLGTIKPLLDAGNNLVGFVQGLLQAHPGLASIATDLTGLAGLSLTGAAGIGMLTKAWALWQLTSRISQVGGLAREFQTVDNSAAALFTRMNQGAGSIGLVNKEAGLLSRTLGGIKNMSTIQWTLAIAAVGAGVEIISWMIEEDKKKKAEIAFRNAEAVGSYEGSVGDRLAFKDYERAMKHRAELDDMARKNFEAFSLYTGYKTATYHLTPGQEIEDRPYPKKLAAEEIRANLPGLADPAVMARLIRQIDQSKLGLDPMQGTITKDILAAALPESYKAAQAFVAQEMAAESKKLTEVTNSMTALLTPSLNLTAGFSGLIQPIEYSNKGLLKFSIEAQAAAYRMRNLDISPPSFTFPSAAAPKPSGSGNPVLDSIFGGGRASGGPVRSGHSYLIGERGPELLSIGRSGFVTPTDRLFGSGGSAGAPSVNITVHVDARGASAGDADHIARTIEQKLDQVLTPDYLARRVVFAARRDQERS